MMLKIVLIIFIFLFKNHCGTHFCYGLQQNDDVHSSVTALHGVFNAEKLLNKNLADYIKESEKEINFVKNFIDNLKHDHRKRIEIMINGTKKESLPQLYFIDSKFLKNLQILKNLLGSIRSSTIKKFKNVAGQYNLPTDKDLEGVILAILRVQEVYDISAEDFANGIINGINFRAKFTASDCFTIALKLKELEYHYYAIGWYKMALKRIEQEGWKGHEPEIKETLIYELLATSQNLEDLKTRVNESSKLYVPKGALNPFNLTMLELLKKGCRQQLRKSSEEERHLFCRYEIKNDPFLIIAPIKVEILSLSPYMVVFHDVIYDSEIEILKELSINKLKRAQVWNNKKGIGEPSLARTSKVAWFDENNHSVFNKLDQRVTDMTGLTMETSESYQLMNYGIGGHYDIHADYLKEADEKNKVKPYKFVSYGNRIATVLFYMSDVSHGGGTVWPTMRVFTTPKKGSAAFWYNLLSDDQPDYRTYHSACPIIVGSKWVLNKWIRARGQIFRRPCNLKRGV